MDLAKGYFKSKGMTYTKWVSEVRSNAQPDVLALFLLSKITKVHCVVHINKNHYWSSLLEELDNREDYLQ